MNYIAKKWCLLCYLLYWGSTRANENCSYGLCGKIIFEKLWIWKIIKRKKQKLQHKCGILPQVNSRVININQNIYHCQNF